MLEVLYAFAALSVACSVGAGFLFWRRFRSAKSEDSPEDYWKDM